MFSLAPAAPIPQSLDAPLAPLFPIEARNLGLSFGNTRIFDNLALNLGPRGCTVIMGPNGVGKSLLLKLLHGVMSPSQGHVKWAGQEAACVTHRHALVFQRPVLLRRSVLANIDFVLKARGKDRSRAMALLAHVGLAHKASHPARRLSGGEAQRLALARALALDPEVLFLDEATASLDPASVQSIERIVLQARSRGVRIICVTHDIGQARRLADDVVFLHSGRVAEHSPANRFFDTPMSHAAQDYLSGRLVF